MDRYDIEGSISRFYKMHPVREWMTVITVINPEELGETRAAIHESLLKFYEVGFYIIVPNQTNSTA